MQIGKIKGAPRMPSKGHSEVSGNGSSIAAEKVILIKVWVSKNISSPYVE